MFSPHRLFWPALVLLATINTGLFSQEQSSCSERLRTARQLFEKGQVDQVPGLLLGCLNSGFTKEEEISAFKMLIQAGQLTDNIRLADSAMNVFLRRNPEYRITPTDHPSFTYLYNSYTVKPVFQAGIHAGVNLPFLTFINENLTAGEPGKSTFRSGLSNLLLSFEARLRLKNKTELSFEPGYSWLSFTNKIDYLGFGTISYSETQHRIEVPVSILYDFKTAGNLTFYSRTGAGIAVNLKTSADASLIMTDRNNPFNRTGEKITRTDSRTPADIFIHLGAGLKYKIPKGYFFTEIRSNIGLLQQNVPGGRSVNLLEYYYLWSDPGFRLNSLSVNAGYIHIFYKPFKKQ